MIKKQKSIILIICMCFFILYITIANAHSNQNILNEGYFNKWNNKKWLTLGDSITKANGYQSLVKEKLGFKEVDNRGINGQTMAYQKTKKSTLYVGREIDYKNYDLVTIFIGTNDFRYNKELGSFKEYKYNEKTFIGAYQLLIEKILESNPYIDIVLVTPLQRSKDGYDINFTNEEGHKLIDYVEAIKEIGKNYSVPVLDLYSNSGFNKQTLNIYTRDNLHPNKVGYERIAEKMYRFLLSI